MDTISDLREKVLVLYSNFEMYITPVVRFLLCLISLIMINSGLGQMEKLNNVFIVLVVSIVAAFLPLNFTIVIDAMFILLHLYSISLPVVAVVALVFLLMFVLYFRFTPKEAIAVVITPMLFAMKIPYVAPLALGFLGTPVSFISVCCGVVVYFIITKIGANPDMFNGSLSMDSAVSGFKSVIDNVLNNSTMILMIVVCALVVVLANVLKRLSFDYAWQVGLAVSAISGLIVVVLGSSILDADVSIVGAIISMIISVILVFILQLFVYNVDYSRAEFVQFQDEEYVYFVKAIPRYGVNSDNDRRGGR